MIIANIIQNKSEIKLEKITGSFQYSSNLYLNIDKDSRFNDYMTFVFYQVPDDPQIYKYDATVDNLMLLEKFVFAKQGHLIFSLAICKNGDEIIRTNSVILKINSAMSEGTIIPSKEDTWISIVERVADTYFYDNFDKKVSEALQRIDSRKKEIDEDIQSFNNDYTVAKEVFDNAINITADNVEKSEATLKEISGKVETSKKEIDQYVDDKEESLRGPIGNVYFTAFKVIKGRLKMYSNPEYNKVIFVKDGSRLKIKIKI